MSVLDYLLVGLGAAQIVAILGLLAFRFGRVTGWHAGLEAAAQEFARRKANEERAAAALQGQLDQLEAQSDRILEQAERLTAGRGAEWN